MNFCNECGTPIENDNQLLCDSCASKASVQGENYFNEQPQFKMKWFKFLIYFALFAGAVVNLVNGFNYITGGIYFVQTNGEVTADLIYSTFGILKAIDVLVGIAMLALACFGVYTRTRLAKYKSDGPMCLYILYIASALITLIYNIAVTVITGVGQIFTPNIVTPFICSLVFVVLNHTYFSKRKVLFVK